MRSAANQNTTPTNEVQLDLHRSQVRVVNQIKNFRAERPIRVGCYRRQKKVSAWAVSAISLINSIVCAV
jgi:hypothetical protein